MTGAPYENGLVCLLCLESQAIKVIFNNDEGNMRKSHLPSKHKKEMDAVAEAAAEAAKTHKKSVDGGASVNDVLMSGAKVATAGVRLLPFLPVPKERNSHRVVISFDTDELNRMYTAATVIHNCTGRSSQHTHMRAFLLAVSGGRYEPPSLKTIVKIERDLERQAKRNVVEAMRSDGVLNAGQELALPLLSLAMDGSTEQTRSGRSTISLRAHWVNVNMEKQTALLCMGAFGFDWNDQTPEMRDLGVCRATAENLARWVCMTLISFSILPLSFKDRFSSGNLNCRKFLFGATADSASNEISLVKNHLGLLYHNDPNHVLSLVAKGAIHARKSKQGDPPREAFPLETLLRKGACLARFNKKGSGGAALYEAQNAMGVTRPVKMVSSNATRWDGDLRIAERLIRLRPVLGRAFRRAETEELTERDWIIVNQSLTFLQAVDDASTTLQSRDLHIGEHVAPLLKLRQMLENPQRMPMLAADFSISVEQANAISGSRMKLLSLDGIEGTCATSFAASINLDPAVESLRKRILDGLLDRSGRRKDQFSSIPTLLAVAIDPYLKVLITPGNETLFPREHHTLGERPLGRAGENWGFKLHATAWSELARLQKDVHANLDLFERRAAHAATTAAAAVTAAASPSSAVPAGAPSVVGVLGGGTKRKKDGDHFAAGLDLGIAAPAPSARRFGDMVDEIEVRHRVTPSIMIWTHPTRQAWRKAPPRAEKASKFWASDFAKAKYPKLAIIARAVLGIAASDVENERDFSALSFVFSKLRRSMSDDTAARKLFLMLNQTYWTANPGLANDAVWMDIMRKVGLAELEEAKNPGSDSDAGEDDE